MTEEDVPNTTFLKWVVVILGILIVGVAIAIGVVVYKRATSSEKNSNPANLSAPVLSPSVLSAATTAFGTIKIPAPDGMAVLEVMQQEGKLLIVYGRNQERPDSIVILDVNTGKILGQFDLTE